MWDERVDTIARGANVIVFFGWSERERILEYGFNWTGLEGIWMEEGYLFIGMSEKITLEGESRILVFYCPRERSNRRESVNS